MEDLLEALLDAGILRLRPVLITVGATVLRLCPPRRGVVCVVQIEGSPSAFTRAGRP